MADIRIKDLPTTASLTASDDFIAIDGTSNGTRKLNSAAPSFLTSVTTPSLTSPAATNLTLGLGTGGTALTLTDTTLAATFAGAVSVSGTITPSGSVHGANGTAANPSFAFNSDQNTGLYRIGADNIGVAANGAKVLDVASTGLTVTGEVTVSGNTIIGTTSTINNARITAQFQSSSGNTGMSLVDAQANNTAGFVNFYSNVTAIGSISNNNNTATSYNTSSDYRLKNSIAPMTGALAKVALLKPVTYKWISNGSDGQGFIAHELAEVAPYAVTGEKDGERMQGVDYGKITPLLAAALQEAATKIKSLEARLVALEAK